MTNVKEILQRTPPSVLYHYTTQEGLLGIISNKELWATHTQYLNDVREFRHALDLAREELSAMASEFATGTVRNYLADIQKVLMMETERHNVCVCSFSEQGDLLSQWRAYGGKASGFAIGFSGEFLREMSKEYGWLVPVVYEEGEQRALIRRLLEDVIEEIINRSKGDQQSPAWKLITYLERYAPILKHKSFSEELEWRIVTKPLQCTNERFGYRTGISMLVPYFRLPLGSRESLGLKEIVIGPTPHPKQSNASLTGLLLKNNIPSADIFTKDGVKIRRSQVPYRNW